MTNHELHLSRKVLELVEDGVIWEVLQLVESDLKEDIFKTAPDDSLARERIYQEMKALSRLDFKLHSLFSNIKFNESRGDD